MTDLTVICARPDGQDEAVGPRVSPVLADFARFTDQIHFAGRFPGKEIDPLLSGRVVVVGEEAHLAAVLLRMLRRGLLGTNESPPPEPGVEVGYVPLSRNAFASRWRLRVGVDGVTVACTSPALPTPLVRDDNGGVLISIGAIEAPDATVYVDDRQVLSGPASRLVVRPDSGAGVEVTVEHRRPLRLPPRKAITLGRAVSIGFREPTVVVSDGVPRPRPLPRWTYYAHTSPWLLARPE